MIALSQVDDPAFMVFIAIAFQVMVTIMIFLGAAYIGSRTRLNGVSGTKAHALYARLSEASVETLELRANIATYRAALIEAERGIEVLTRQLEDAQIAPAYKPDITIEIVHEISSQAQTRALLARYFDLEGLRNLAFDMGFPSNEIDGNTPATYSRNLIVYATQHARYPELLNMARAARPQVSWPTASGL